MAFKEVLRFLYERAKTAKGGVLTQEEYGAWHGLPRSAISQILSGKTVPAAKTMWRILEREGYDLNDCLELPEQRLRREGLLIQIEAILRRKDETSRFLAGILQFLDWQATRDLEAEHAPLPAASRSPPRARSKQRRVVS